ncbi:type II toxin-antitoxin system HipA family toxin [Acidovorax sp. BLS4]|uniref:type II toxin-antitoxin system HipA family toxin n=1 Tax=Acidovorax sp. BLS4 TaxID=3273430 RepID=UPI002943335F|nr:type II toxin-antitoxin system HipA family toxin [Paracidovorax avenae]WOI44471.1 type II toxin-antitoxin system HipA family toxin [Paracidovorax avenae]
MSKVIRQLRVLLNEVPVGRLTLDDAEICEFHLYESYRKSSPRLVLGQQFEDDLFKHYRARSRLPRWFSNLLPEGALRKLVEEQAGHREFDLLVRLGKDLPGAVRIEVEPNVGGTEESADWMADSDPASPLDDGTWHFSLAGVQLKFSANRIDRGMTIPVSGQGGDWILKLPDPRFPNVPANEYATMRWAAASGINIPEIDLLDLSSVIGLPQEGVPRHETQAFAIRRFDRPSADGRVHMEDLAQVLNLYPEQKYSQFNYETIARLTLELAGHAALKQLVTRLVFMLASGNGDAHHKNWSFLYPDGVRAELSPAYDQVSTIQYMTSDSLALNLGGTKLWADKRVETFVRLARKIGFDEREMGDWVGEAVTAVCGAWSAAATDFGYDQMTRKRIESHMNEIPVLKGA